MYYAVLYNTKISQNIQILGSSKCFTKDIIDKIFKILVNACKIYEQYTNYFQGKTNTSDYKCIFFVLIRVIS